MRPRNAFRSARDVEPDESGSNMDDDGVYSVRSMEVVSPKIHDYTMTKRQLWECFDGQAVFTQEQWIHALQAWEQTMNVYTPAMDENAMIHAIVHAMCNVVRKPDELLYICMSKPDECMFDQLRVMWLFSAIFGSQVYMDLRERPDMRRHGWDILLLSRSRSRTATEHREALQITDGSLCSLSCKELVKRLCAWATFCQGCTTMGFLNAIMVLVQIAKEVRGRRTTYDHELEKTGRSGNVSSGWFTVTGTVRDPQLRADATAHMDSVVQLLNGVFSPYVHVVRRSAEASVTHAATVYYRLLFPVLAMLNAAPVYKMEDVAKRVMKLMAQALCID